MDSTSLRLPEQLDARTIRGARIADLMADELSNGPGAALKAARGLTEGELRDGLAFLTTVLELAAGSARVLAEVLADRRNGPSTWQ